MKKVVRLLIAILLSTTIFCSLTACNQYLNDDNYSNNGVTTSLPASNTDDDIPSSPTNTTDDIVTVYLLTECTYLDSKGEEKTKYEYSYDDKGYLVQYSFFSRAQEDRRWVFEYDSTGKLAQSTRYSVYGGGGTIIGSQTTYEYNDSDNTVLATEYRDGTLYTTKQYAYDDYGQPTSYILYRNNGDTQKTQYVYDSNGNVILELYDDSDGDFSQTTYEYDNHGTLTLSVYYHDNTEFSRKTYESEYNSAGNIISAITYDKNGVELSRYIYEYTDSGKKLLSACINVDQQEIMRMEFCGNELLVTESDSISKYQKIILDQEQFKELRILSKLWEPDVLVVSSNTLPFA